MAVPVALIAAGISLGSAYIKSRQAKKNAETLSKNRPVLPNNAYAKDQQAFAENELARGSSTDAMDRYNQGADRDFANSLNAILKNGGDVNDVGSLFDGSDQGRQRARMMSENIRLNNINSLVRAYQNSDQASQDKFKFSDWAPWADKTQANAVARTEANTQMWSAFDTASAAAVRKWGGNNNNLDSNNGGVSSAPSMQSARVNSAFYVPSVASKYDTIDPNALNNLSTYSFNS